MPANKHALIRYKIIDNCLTNKFRRYPSLERLKEACEEALGEGLHLSTIQKDIDAMRNDGALGYDAPIAYSKLHKGYYYTDSDFTINAVALDDASLDAIQFAAATLYQFRDTDIFKNFQSALDRIYEAVKARKLDDAESLEALIQFEKAPFVKGTEFLSAIVRAIKNCEKIRFTYRKFDSDKSKTHTVHPYLLKEYQERWYVVGLLEKIEKITVFGLDRIEELQVLDNDCFERNKNFDPGKIFNNVIGVTLPADKPQWITLSFSPLQGNYIKTKKIHQSQTVLVDNEKECRVQLKVVPTRELLMQILSWGPEVKVVEPASLKKQIRDLLKSTLKNYSG